MRDKNLSLKQVNTEQMTNIRRPILTIKPKAYIFDIDGTLSDPSHRVHLYKDKKYDEFNAACDQDPPFKDVCRLCKILSDDYEIVFLTGRTEVNRRKTEDWIFNNIGLKSWQYTLLMRKDGDQQHSVDMKFEQYQKIKSDFNIVGIFEDRKHIVDMWRRAGETCFAMPSLFD